MTGKKAVQERPYQSKQIRSPLYMLSIKLQKYTNTFHSNLQLNIAKTVKKRVLCLTEQTRLSLSFLLNRCCIQHHQIH